VSFLSACNSVCCPQFRFVLNFEQAKAICKTAILDPPKEKLEMECLAKSLRYLLLFVSSVTALLFFFTGTGSASPVPIPVPYITGISPVSVLPGGADFILTINGANFRPCSSMVYWGSTLLTPNSVSTTKLTVTVPASLIASAALAGSRCKTPAIPSIQCRLPSGSQSGCHREVCRI